MAVPQAWLAVGDREVLDDKRIDSAGFRRVHPVSPVAGSPATVGEGKNANLVVERCEDHRIRESFDEQGSDSHCRRNVFGERKRVWFGVNATKCTVDCRDEAARHGAISGGVPVDGGQELLARLRVDADGLHLPAIRR